LATFATFPAAAQAKLSVAEGRMSELDSQLALLTGASGALVQQLEQQQEAAAAAAAAARQVRETTVGLPFKTCAYV
jgi:hypothetical protein